VPPKCTSEVIARKMEMYILLSSNNLLDVYMVIIVGCDARMTTGTSISQGRATDKEHR
jgi:hypothetical protein